ncbi:hypothetical protein NY551_19010 [Curtobacterium flaccumfaciens pv. oortii]|uniref:hypothetical protein n=1 Tax=Curtobacterium flaccumfaciens TaxID=2035 RepID=UPI00265AD72F|nr:hypothetical protein [Curtobacterium flaccumfaciens]MCS5524831.1 hypothetical protein [Curtobacterium flaccumfaciens pv. oortii]
MTPRRLPRGTRKDPVTLGYDVERVNKDKWAEIAADAGVSPSALFDRMVETIERDENGVPTWFKRSDEELPIEPA